MKRVFRYGLLAPIEHGDIARRVLRAGHDHQNLMIEIVNRARASRRSVETASSDVSVAQETMQRAKELYEEKKQELMRARAQRRARAVPKGLVEETKDLKKAWVDARKVFDAARKRNKEDSALKVILTQAYEDQKAATRAARSTSPLAEKGELSGGWGTYILAEDAVAQADKKARLFDDGRPNDLKYRRWDGSGRIGVLVHQKGPEGKGFPSECIMDGSSGASSWLYLALSERDASVVTDAAHPKASVRAARERNRLRRQAALEKGGGSLRERRILRARVATIDGKAIMAAWPVVLHRPLPRGATITRAIIVCRRIGPREEWSLHLVVSGGEQKYPPAEKGVVAVDIRHGERVAYWVDDEGNAGELCLSTSSKADELRSIRDQAFNKALESFVLDLRREGVPEWIRSRVTRKGQPLVSSAQAIAWIASWRSPARLASLAREFRAHKDEGLASSSDALETWRYHDYHLWAWETSQRSGEERHRTDKYRVFAARLATRYGKLLVSDERYDLRARRPRPEEERGKAAPIERVRMKVAAGSLRSTLEQAFVARGREMVRVDSSKVRECPSCGIVEDAARHADGAFACGECGYETTIRAASCLAMLRAEGIDVRGIMSRQESLRHSFAAAE